MNEFVHLHLHTQYSLLDGSARARDVIARAKELKMTAVAITDHGVMYGVIDFYNAATAEGIKPIIGCEVYVASGSRFNKEAGNDNFYYHLILLAETNEGFANLIKLVSSGFTEGFYYKPRIDIELLKKHKNGLIALSACTAGVISKEILRGGYEKGKQAALLYKDIFGSEHFYIELTDHGLKEQKTVNPHLLRIAKETGLGAVCTNDCHYISSSDAQAHSVLLCIQTGKNINDENRMTFESDQLYIKSYDEMCASFPNAHTTITNTAKIAERCNVTITFGEYRLPNYDAPKGYTARDYLTYLCKRGAAQRYGGTTAQTDERLSFELDTINEMGFTDYFLVVWDFIKYARENGIAVGPGRGSAAGSIVAYCLYITDIDPLKYNLLFERFLNPERVTMPDIDIDFCYERRQEVIDYVTNKYGADKVAQIITFGTMSAKACIRDVGRALAMPYGEVDKIAKLIPADLGITITKALTMNLELANMYKNDENTQKLIDMSVKLEGLPRHASTHAAGVVICSRPITDFVPLNVNDGVVTTQYPMNTLESLGLLKMDFLGLRTLTVIQKACNMIGNIDIKAINYDEKEVYALLSSGKTEGVFQLESAGMKAFMKELKPACLADVIAGIALYRPGPMDFIPKYIAGKKDPSRITYTHPRLEPILKETYGCIVYQEQVMQIVRELAGYSLARSDLMRRAMSKKKADVMAEERKSFIYGNEQGVPGCIKNGIPKETAQRIFDEMTDFANYAFNKSHATAYAVIGYQTAWLKYHYKTEFMAALLSSYSDSSDKVIKYINECKKQGIEIAPPDINKSECDFCASNGKIHFALSAVKNVGRGFVNALVAERAKNGAYKSLADLAGRVDGSQINKRAIESLIKAGAFDSLGGRRSGYLAAYEQILKTVSQNKQKCILGQMSLFDGQAVDDSIQDNLPALKEFDKLCKLRFEKDVLGVYLSGHPLEDYAPVLSRYITASYLDMAQSSDTDDSIAPNPRVKDGQAVCLGGIISEKKVKYTKNNKTMAFVTLTDIDGAVELIVFPNLYERLALRLEDGAVIIAKGRASIREEEDAKLLCDEIYFYEDLATQLSRL